MIGADRDRYDPVGVLNRPHPGHRMPYPGQGEPTRTQHRLVAADGANLPAILNAQPRQLGPEIRARNAARRSAHLDHEGRRLPAQSGCKIRREIAGYGDAGEPCLHVSDACDWMDGGAHRILAGDWPPLRRSGRPEQEARNNRTLEIKVILPYMISDRKECCNDHPDRDN